MQIKKIHIQNYRSFNDSSEQPITKLFALIGKNNSGKSAFISAIQSAWGTRKLTELDMHKNNGKPIKIKLFTEEINVSGEDPKQMTIACEFNNGDMKYWVDEKELKKLPASLPKLLVIPAIRNPEEQTTAGKDSFLKELVGAIVDLKAKDAPLTENFKEKIAKDLSLDEIKSLLEHKTSKQLLNIEQIISGYVQSSLDDNDLNVFIKPDGDLSKAIKYSTKIKEPYLADLKDGVDVMNCGTGLQSMVIMALLQTYADLQKQEDSILLIEEPEVYLHPDFQRKMFSVLRKIAKRTQVIYTTHSPIMISDLWDDSVRLITRQLGESIISEIDIQGVVRELGIRYDDILNPKVVIFVEGPSDTLFYKRVIELKYPHISSNLDVHIKFIETGGFEAIHLYALMNILLSSNVNALYYILVDGDGKNSETRKAEILDKIKKRIQKYEFILDKNKLKDIPKHIRSLSRYAIEAYFLDYDLLKFLEPTLSKEEVDYFLAHYSKFSTFLEKVGRSHFHSAKPKLLFENPNTEGQLVLFRKDFGDDKRFLDIRSRLIDASISKKMSKESLIDTIINKHTINHEILKEPIAFLDEILKVANIQTNPSHSRATMERAS